MFNSNMIKALLSLVILLCNAYTYGLHDEVYKITSRIDDITQLKYLPEDVSINNDLQPLYKGQPFTYSFRNKEIVNQMGKQIKYNLLSKSWVFIGQKHIDAIEGQRKTINFYAELDQADNLIITQKIIKEYENRRKLRSRLEHKCALHKEVERRMPELKESRTPLKSLQFYLLMKNAPRKKLFDCIQKSLAKAPTKRTFSVIINVLKDFEGQPVTTLYEALGIAKQEMKKESIKNGYKRYESPNCTAL